jgi:hypothetical protein
MVSLKFDADGQAIEWWPLGKSKLVVLTPKRSFGQPKNPANRAAWRESGLTAFFLKGGWQNQEIWIYASRFFWWWPKIVTQAELAQRKGLPDTVQEHAIRGRSAPLTHGDL